MARRDENSGFSCAHCGQIVAPIPKGSIRNHCPACLHSLHVDIAPGDRLSDCHGLMKPTGLRQHSQKGWQIRHECTKCGFSRMNIAADDDDFDLIVKLSSG
ncbi:MAG: RNHCP domain-containing protein [Defluviitaleaceae bacterium]|nr:RNHCP domain-containing protein [Defluviitaleaceae bacterium]